MVSTYHYDISLTLRYHYTSLYMTYYNIINFIEYMIEPFIKLDLIETNYQTTISILI